MYRLSTSLFFSIILFVSCNSNDDSCSVEQGQDPNNFYALNIGNSWEYEVYRYSSQIEGYEIQDLLIKTSINSTSIVNGETYYNFSTTSTGSYICESCVIHMDLGSVRDSLGYLVNQQGTIAYSRSSQEDYLVRETLWGDIYGVLLPDNVNISTSAGNFIAIQNERYAILSNGEISIGRDFEYFAEDIGFVFKTNSSVGNPVPLNEMKLKSYILED